MAERIDDSPSIDEGELFIVIRGFALSMDSPSMFESMLFGCSTQTKSEQQYDRSYNGHVYKAIEICGPSIVGERVWPPARYMGDPGIGNAVAFNREELKLWPVTKKYFESLSKSKSIHPPTPKESRG